MVFMEAARLGLQVLSNFHVRLFLLRLLLRPEDYYSFMEAAHFHLLCFTIVIIYTTKKNMDVLQLLSSYF